MKVIITGGAGFIGSAVIRHILANTRFEVVNVDKLTYAGNLDSLGDVGSSKRYFFENIDICDEVGLSKVFDKHKPDAVMHLAAESHVDRSIDGPREFILTNIVGTFTLLEQSRKYFEGLNEEKRKHSGFITSRPMRFMAILMEQMICSLKQRLMHLLRLIQRAKQVQII